MATIVSADLSAAALTDGAHDAEALDVGYHQAAKILPVGRPAPIARGADPPARCPLLLARLTLPNDLALSAAGPSDASSSLPVT